MSSSVESSANTITSQATWIAQGNPATDLPGWVAHLIAGGATHVSHCVSLDGLQAKAITKAARHAFLRCIDTLPGSPCRVWSFLPRITEHDDDTIERYMRFNIGRTSAYRDRANDIVTIPAGTCVGHAGTELVVHALHQTGTMRAVENPRQKPAWQYSQRYGPVPPAFTRGIVMNSTLLASGTAAIVGETSMHEGDFTAQFAETLRNLAALASACGNCRPWRSVQLYVRDANGIGQAEYLGRQAFGDELERVLCASLCRRELLVEIEGVADVI